MDEITKVLVSGLPAWTQGVILCLAFGLQYLLMRRKQNAEIDKRIVEAEKHNESLKQKSLLLHNATETFYNEKYHIKKVVFTDQREISSRILQQFINNLGIRYEQGLQSMEIDTRDSELLILAFEGFLSKIKEEIMVNVEKFITSKDFESDNYSDTENSIVLVGNQISLHINSIFKNRYSEKRYRVKFSDGISKGPVVEVVSEIYKQAKKRYDLGESKIDNLRKIYEESTQSIIGGAV